MTDPADASSDPKDQTAALRAELERLIERARGLAADAGLSGDEVVARGRAAAEAGWQSPAWCWAAPRMRLAQAPGR